MEQSYVAVDLETTGLEAKRDKIIEIGAIHVVKGREIAAFHSMVNPHRRLKEQITELTGITDDMVENAPDIGDIIEEFAEFCGQAPLLGHRIMFDYSFLKRAAVNHGIPFEKNGIDTLKLCRHFLPEDQPKNLSAACEFFGIRRKKAHRALEDARDAHYLYQRLAEWLLTKDCPLFLEIGTGSGKIKEEDLEDVSELRLGNKEVKEVFMAKPMIYKVKKEQPATKKQKEDLRYLLKYHKIDVPVEIDHLSRNEVSRLQDQIIFQYGRIQEINRVKQRG
ncbi:MAG: 3'-5' exonuclease [Lachnospiraceae bacterium]|nr:3'-5' exonuclease [Lachnospiraceae bacterium]